MLLKFVHGHGPTEFNCLTGVIRLQGNLVTSGNQITLTFIGNGTNQEILTELGELSRMVQFARRWQADPLDDQPVWLETKIDGEAVTRRRCLIDAGPVEWVNGIGLNLLDSQVKGSQTVKFTQTFVFAYPYWEEKNITNVNTGSISNLMGGDTIQLTTGSPLTGDAPGRIAVAGITWLNAAYLSGYIALQAVKPGTQNPLWHAASTATHGTGVTVTADSEAKSGNRAVASHTNGYRPLVTFTVSPSSTPPVPEYQGRYLVLLRYSLPAAGAMWEIETKWGFDMAGQRVVSNIILPTTGNVYDVIELGTVQMPSGIPRGKFAPSDSFKVQIAGGVISGTEPLRLAEIYLLPADHLIKFSSMIDNPTSPSIPYGVIYTHENGDNEGYMFDQPGGIGVTSAKMTLEPHNWQIPFQPDREIYAYIIWASNSGYSNAGAVAGIQFDIHRGWENYSS